MKRLASVLCLVVLMTTSLGLRAQEKKKIYYFDEKEVPREHPLDFQHLKLEVAFLPEEGKVMGTVYHDFKVLRHEVDSAFIDGPGIVIKDISMDGSAITYRKKKEGFMILFGKTLHADEIHQMVIKYEANPKKGIYFIGWNDESNRSRKQIWTQGQGIDNRHWIPMYDLPNDKVTTEMIVTMDSKYEVLSNGSLVKKKQNKSGESIWHYKMKLPHTTYLIMLGIGEYSVKRSKSPSGVPMNFYYYPDWEDRVDPTYKFSEDMMRFMEEETGIPYPWGSYSQIPVQNFLYGAMENTSATIFGDFLMVDERAYLDRNYVRVNAHELAHQWFGDYVSARTSTHTWLQESFATHYDLRYQGIAFGQDYFHWARRKAAEAALRASTFDLKPLMHSSAGTARHYPKGSYVLQMLRDVTGEENYKKAIHYYLKKHGLENVDSHDLLISFHEAVGLSLDWFWEEWVYHGGEPYYKVEFETSHHGEDHYGRFMVEQIQEVNEFTGLFKMPMGLEIHFEDGSKVGKRVWVEEQNHIFDFEIPPGKNIAYALFDAGSKVLKQVDFEKPFDMLIHQALKAENVLDRYDAVKALSNVSIDIKRTTLRNIFESDDFHAVRTEAFRQLMFDPPSAEIWKLALTDKDNEVRKSALQYTTLVRPDLVETYISLLNDPSYEIVEMALSKLCAEYEGTERVHEFLDATDGLEGNNERNVLITWLQIDYYEHNNVESLKKLIDMTSPSYEFRTRVKAANTLKALNHLDEEFLANLMEGNFSYNARLRSPMKKILDYYATTLNGKKMIREFTEKGEWNDWEKRRLNLIKL